MQAILFPMANGNCQIREVKTPSPSAGEVLVKIKATALNRRDHWIKKGIYQGAAFPCIPGSDGAGEVIKTGKGVNKKWLNKEVIINPALQWGNQQDYHQEDFQILGLPSQGTMAEFVCVPEENLHEKPVGWSFEKSAALPLAALTAYRALFFRGELKKGQKVFITGAGGGVAVYLIQFAIAAGARVFVSSSSEKKIKKAISLGAENGVLYTGDNWTKNLEELSGNQFDLIIDSAAGENFGFFPSLLRTGGKIVIFGGTAGKIPELTAAKLFWNQASVLGTTMGSPQDFENMMNFVQAHNLEPVIDKIFPMVDAELAFKHMENHEQFGKIVIKID